MAAQPKSDARILSPQPSATDERESADKVSELMVAYLARGSAATETVPAYHREVDGLREVELIRWTIWHLGVITRVLE